jgi:hypothetical protein
MFAAFYETSVCSHLNVNFVVSFINKNYINLYIVTFVTEGVLISKQNGGTHSGDARGCSRLVFNAYNFKQMCVRVWCVVCECRSKYE